MLVLILSLFVAAGTEVTVVRELHSEVLCPSGRSVKVVHHYGDLRISGSASEKAKMDAIIRVTGRDKRSATELADKIDIGIVTRDETLFVVTSYPRHIQPCPVLSYEVDVRLVVPEGASLVAHNAFGGLMVSGVKGGCRLANRFGDVGLDRCQNCDVVSRYGDVWVWANTGFLLVDNRFGNVFLDEVTDRVRVENRYGNVKGTGLDGIVHLDNRFGDVRTRHSRGSLTVANHYGDISAWVEDSALTDLDVMSELGRVELNLARMVPYQLGGRTVQGLIRSTLPLQVDEQGCRVHGFSGHGGARVHLSGTWTDFFIQSEPIENADGNERR